MEQLQIQVTGHASPTLVFIHGWPDGPELWQELIEHFSKSYRCVAVTLPHFGRDPQSASDLSFLALVELLASTIKNLSSASSPQKVILIGHDWGAYLCYMLESAHPELVEKMVTLDIGAHTKITGPMQALMIMGYQWSLIKAWGVGRILPSVGNLITRVVAKIVGAPHPQQASWRMNYLYFYLWRGMLCKKYGHTILKKYSLRVPVLFIYGKLKPFMFHSAAWLKRLRERPDSAVVEMEHSGHWITRDEPERTKQVIDSWLRQT